MRFCLQDLYTFGYYCSTFTRVNNLNTSSTTVSDDDEEGQQQENEGLSCWGDEKSGKHLTNRKQKNSHMTSEVCGFLPESSTTNLWKTMKFNPNQMKPAAKDTLCTSAHNEWRNQSQTALDQTTAQTVIHFFTLDFICWACFLHPEKEGPPNSKLKPYACVFRPITAEVEPWGPKPKVGRRRGLWICFLFFLFHAFSTWGHACSHVSRSPVLCLHVDTSFSL